MLEFLLPDVGEGIDAAELLMWHVAAGQVVAEDQPLCDVQTDKAIVTLPCPGTGTILELCADPGDVVPVGQPLIRMDAEARAPGGDEASAEADASAASAGADATAGRAASVAEATRPLAAPATRRLARELGVDLGAVAGSGPQGRITRADVEAADAGGGAAAAGTGSADPATGGAAPAAGGVAAAAGTGSADPATGGAAPAGGTTVRTDEVVPLRGVRRAIARTLTRSWQTIPHMTDMREVDATALLATRDALRASAQRDGRPELARALTVTPLVVKICAAALRRHPYVNASVDLEREEILLRGAVDIGIAVAAPDGLTVPVVHGADGKSVEEIALEVAELGAAARDRSLTPAQLAGATFTVNNYGSLGVWLGTPIIAPPQVANFGIGRVDERAVVRDGEILARHILPVAVSGDHRVLDGHTLAAFVSDVAALITDPVLLLAELR